MCYAIFPYKHNASSHNNFTKWYMLPIFYERLNCNDGLLMLVSQDGSYTPITRRRIYRWHMGLYYKLQAFGLKDLGLDIGRSLFENVVNSKFQWKSIYLKFLRYFKTHKDIFCTFHHHPNRFPINEKLIFRLCSNPPAIVVVFFIVN